MERNALSETREVNRGRTRDIQTHTSPFATEHASRLLAGEDLRLEERHDLVGLAELVRACCAPLRVLGEYAGSSSF